MSNRLPSDVTAEEAASLLGDRLVAPHSYQRALVASAWRTEALLVEILAELRAARAQAAPPAFSEAAPTPAASTKKRPTS